MNHQHLQSDKKRNLESENEQIAEGTLSNPAMLAALRLYIELNANINMGKCTSDNANKLMLIRKLKL